MLELERKKNIRLGLFVVLGILLLILGLFYVGKDDSYFTRSVNLYTNFNDADGLRRGNNVWLSGVKIGTVTDVRVSSDTSVTATMKINHREIAFVDKDATVYISSEGIIGNKLLVVVPGKSNIQIEDGAYISSLSSSPSGDLMTTFKTTGERINVLAEELGKTVEKINGGQGVVGQILNDSDMASKMKSAIIEIEATGKNSARLTSNVERLLAEMSSNKDGAISTLVSDTSFARIYHETLQNLKKAGENSAKITRDFAEITAKMEDENNSLEVLFSDTAFANNLRKTMASAADASKSLSEDAEALQHNIFFRRYFRKQEKNK